MFHTECAGMFMIYNHTKLHMTSCNGVLDVFIKQNIKYRFCTSTLSFLMKLV